MYYFKGQAENKWSKGQKTRWRKKNEEELAKETKKDKQFDEELEKLKKYKENGWKNGGFRKSPQVVD